MQTTNIEINPTRARNYVGVRCTQGDGKKDEALSGGVEETRKISVGRRCCRYSHVVYVADRSRLLEEPGRGKRSRTRSQRLGRSRERRQLGCQIYRSKKRAGKHSFLSFLIKKIGQKTTFLFGSLKVKRDELLNGSRGKQPLRLVRDNFAAEDHEGQYVRGDNRWWCVAAGSCLEGRQGCREGREQHQRPTWWRGASSRSRSSSGSSGVRAE